MAWPNPNEYAEAMQNPRGAFQDAELIKTQVKSDRFGLPRAISGNFATVFEVKNGTQRWAVRCFMREVTNQQQRYAAISAHLQQHALDCFVPFDYLPEGIRVRGKWYPILKMAWASEATLDTYIEQHLDEPETLARLAEHWFELCAVLRAARVVHGDFQHGNIIVGADTAIKLLDYDGMLVPGAVHLPSHERGHRHYQHPLRESDQGITEANYLNVDNFSAHVVGLSLQALAIDAKLWQFRDPADENLLFRDVDYKAPDKSDTLRLMHEHPDVRIRQIGQKMAQIARAASYLDVPPLDNQPPPDLATRVSSWFKGHLVPPPTPDVVAPFAPLTAPPTKSSWWQDHVEDPIADFDALEVDQQVARITREFESTPLRYVPFLFRDYLSLRLMYAYPHFSVVAEKARVERTERELGDQLALLKARHKRTEASLEEAHRQFAEECTAHTHAVEQFNNALRAADEQEPHDLRRAEQQTAYVQEQLTRLPVEPDRIPGISRAHVELLAQVGIRTAADVRPANEARAKYVLSGFRNAHPVQDWEELLRWRGYLERVVITPNGEAIPFETVAQVKRRYADHRAALARGHADAQTRLETARTHSPHLRQIEQLSGERDSLDLEIDLLTQKLTGVRDELRRYEHITLRNLLKRVLR